MASVSSEWQALLALTAAFVAGTTLALVLAGWVGLPSVVSEQGDSIVELQRNDAAQETKLERIDCIVTAMATKVDPIGRCGL